MHISFEALANQFLDILLKHGFAHDKATTCAQVFAENSLDGVYTHGVNRFSRFISYVQKGFVQKDSEPELKHSFGAIEQWNGNAAPGILNALHCTNRAIELAAANGIGMVGLANTNHWMRGGTYGWHAARRGYALISWTNTINVMPAWGATQAKLGNNPLVFAVPYQDEAIVLDMAMSQFSFGKMELYANAGEALPAVGGFDDEGQLTNEPSKIIASGRPLPIGYWKGSGLALLLDVLAAILSGGQATKDISTTSIETNVSQVFIAIDLSKVDHSSAIHSLVHSIISDLKNGNADMETDVRYPGEGVVRTRKENLKNGIPVNRSVWEEILKL